MDKDEIKKKIMEEEDYIRCPKFNNSLAKFLANNSEGIDDNAIARLLMISEEEVKALYEDSIKMFKKNMVDQK